MAFLHIPGHDPQGEYWQGYVWSGWYPFPEVLDGRGESALGEEDRASGYLDSKALYRFRIRRRQGLLYIGQTGRCPQRRLRNHRQGMRYALGELRLAPGRRLMEFHYRLADYARQRARLEVSWTPVQGLPKGDRLGIEAELIAAYRSTMGRNPECQFLGSDDDEEDL